MLALDSCLRRLDRTVSTLTKKNKLSDCNMPTISTWVNVSWWPSGSSPSMVCPHPEMRPFSHRLAMTIVMRLLISSVGAWCLTLRPPPNSVWDSPCFSTTPSLPTLSSKRFTIRTDLTRCLRHILRGRHCILIMVCRLWKIICPWKCSSHLAPTSDVKLLCTAQGILHCCYLQCCRFQFRLIRCFTDHPLRLKELLAR